ncbi:hypothetical protein, partial [Streptomyces pseudoechinosporeus]
MNVTAENGAQRARQRARRVDDDEHLTIARKTITALADRLSVGGGGLVPVSPAQEAAGPGLGLDTV